MNETLIVGRREFTLEAVLALLSGVVISVSGCGGGGSSASPTSPSASSSPVPPVPGGNAASISANHGHAATITGAQMTAGNAVQLDIRGAADHPHTITLSADAVRSIGEGIPVTTNSTTNASGSTGAHMHRVTFNPESPEPPIEY